MSRFQVGSEPTALVAPLALASDASAVTVSSRLGLGGPVGPAAVRPAQADRDSHDNVNFPPAMREFGLIAE